MEQKSWVECKSTFEDHKLSQERKQATFQPFVDEFWVFFSAASKWMQWQEQDGTENPNRRKKKSFGKRNAMKIKKLDSNYLHLTSLR